MSRKPGSGGSVTYGPGKSEVRIECPVCGGPRYYRPKEIAALASLNCARCKGRINRLRQLAAQGYQIEECCRTCAHYRLRSCGLNPQDPPPDNAGRLVPELRPAGRGPVAGLKLIGIEKLLEWAFGAEQVQLEAPQHAGTLPSGMGFSSMQNALTQIAALGCRVDTSARGATFLAGEASAHWDAEACAAVVTGAIERKVAALVASYARAGTRPTWMPGAEPKVVPAAWDQNQWGQSPASEAANPAHYRGGVWRKWMDEVRGSRKAAAKYGLAGREALDEFRKHLGRCTPVVYEPSLQQITRSRETYTSWRSALAEVREQLIEAKALKSHALTRELPPATPWLGANA